MANVNLQSRRQSRLVLHNTYAVFDVFAGNLLVAVLQKLFTRGVGGLLVGRNDPIRLNAYKISQWPYAVRSCGREGSIATNNFVNGTLYGLVNRNDQQ